MRVNWLEEDEISRNLAKTRLNLKEFKKNRERLKNTPKFELTQELFEDLFFEGWNRNYHNYINGRRIG